MLKLNQNHRKYIIRDLTDGTFTLNINLTNLKSSPFIESLVKSNNKILERGDDSTENETELTELNEDHKFFESLEK